MKDTIILKNETIIEIETGASLSSLGVVSADKAAMVATWDALTEANLEEVSFKNGDGILIAFYENLMLVSETSTINDDGSIITYFNLREKTETELRLEALEEGQADQDAAIEDLGIITSELASVE